MTNSLHDCTAGSTHPSFSDVFLILPKLIDRLTGLHADSEQIMTMTVGAVEDFLEGKANMVQQRTRTLGKMEEQVFMSIGTEELEGQDGKAGAGIGMDGKIQKVGEQGKLVFHPIEDNTVSGTTA